MDNWWIWIMVILAWAALLTLLLRFLGAGRDDYDLYPDGLPQRDDGKDKPEN